MPSSPSRPRIGFTCAYTPLPLVHAAGFVPYRILPLGDAPDQAGSVLHDNLCPHVKRVLDRALAADLPPLAGALIVNSCDAMRRLGDAWRAVRPSDRVVQMDLPARHDESAAAYFASELDRVGSELSAWAGRPLRPESVLESMRLYDELAGAIEQLAERASRGGVSGGLAQVQRARNRSVTEPPQVVLEEAKRALAEPAAADGASAAVPVLLFGNVLADPAAFDLFEGCGLRPVHDDVCTGGRQLARIGVGTEGEPTAQLARALLSRPACARTLGPADPGALADRVATLARSHGARGVVAHVMKFCDPYLARLPAVRERLKAEGVPLLVLEGDCTLRSLGQHRTRIQAFAEMLGGSAP
jgi:benzoyl-CoA reductase/2-hydroxyglutaryl-CoA dehydratase subunit BcrC/BadD/HgdB